MFRLAYSSNAYTKTTLTEALRRISRLGFEAVEILADEPHLNPLTVSDPDLADIKATLRSENLAISNINVNTNKSICGREFYPSLISPDVSMRRQRIDYIKRSIELAGELDSGSISVSIGSESESSPDSKNILIESLELILEHAAKYPIKVGIEYEPGHCMGDYKSVLSVLNIINSGLLGFNFDLGHSYCLREPYEQIITANSGRIWNFHLEDIKDFVHYHLIIGQGGIDHGRFFSLLNSIGFKGFVTIELYPYTDMPDEAGFVSLRRIRELIF